MARGKDFKLKNVKKFMKNLNKEIEELKGRTLKGLIEAAIVLQREAEPGTPLDLGNLRSSWFIVTYKTGAVSSSPTFKGEESSNMSTYHNTVLNMVEARARQLGTNEQPVLIFGYSANYATYVHENLGADFQRPSAEARWLYAAMQRSREKMLKKIQENAKFE